MHQSGPLGRRHPLVAVVTTIAVLVPCLNRPQNAQPLMASFKASKPDARLIFVVTASDKAEIQAISDGLQVVGMMGVGFVSLDDEAGPGDYARKINVAYRNCDESYVLCAADDLRFHPGWDSALLAVAREYDVGVVGTNDLANGAVLAGKHSTHPLVSRCYIDSRGGYVGGEGKVYFEGYDHQFVDVELVETAMQRGCYAHCRDAVVEHLHPLWRKAETDATYRKGQANGKADARLYQSRRHLWLTEGVVV